MNEIWKTIIDYPQYEISNFGNIKSNYKNKLLKGQKDKDGYFQVNLYKDKIGKTHKVHRLVAKYFIDNAENKLQVNHIDGNKQNNYYLNLEWCTTQENTKHAILNELTDAKGVKHGNSKLKESDVIEIRSLDLPLKDIAKKFNISFQHVSDIKLRKKWKHI